ncbi:zinc finger matrin-type protein CG9776-like isoform X2 [Ostrinia furnacalis]|uniref:zinc finger matrin-type protein CG9776-like isoform X2 n=1 Tax=Ostrinia furnacalis TaxID=93504 RepID=UPI00103D9B20|nr:zinc finger matrin-type protein CG9776-like isoform X2 [Ostrinia furnacalis]
MSRDPRKPYGLPPRERDRERNWRPAEYSRRSRSRKRSRSRSPMRRDIDARARSPRRNDKDVLDDNILSEISKLPEPSELWDGQNQEPNFPTGPPPPPNFRPEPSNPQNFQTYQPSYSGIYEDFPPVPPSQIPPEIASWNQMSLPPPPAPAPVFVNNIEDQMKKEAAIESEMRHQKAALSKQREDYIKKAGILKKELDTLKDQRNELRGDAKRSPSPDTKRFLKENTKLQLEIQNKLKTINNVVDMLNGIIGEEAQELREGSADSDRERPKRKSRSPANKKVNYVYYDPEMHWCRVCNEFPPTAKDYLNHLHSQAHHKMAAAHMEAPWHSVSGVNEGFPSIPSAPTKRTPIRGLQFFVPSTAWYCKLCDQFIGDLHCASAHLKSVQHSKNYTNFVEQNPHWETDWMSDRQKAFEKSRANKGKTEEKPQYAAHTITFHKDGFHTKRKDNSPPPPEKKRKKEKKKKSKKKHSSSSSDSSRSSSSDSDDDAKKKKKKSKKKFEPDEKTLSQWMSAIQAERLNATDRKLLDNLKNRFKIEKSDDKRRSPEKDREHSNSESRKTRERERESERRERSPHERRESRDTRDSRDTRESRDARDSRESRKSRSRETRDEQRRRSPSQTDVKKPEIRKMPFIGKMPVYKHLGKTIKQEEQKKEEQKKKGEEEASKKRREEMDAEIQKKVAEFKEKIARAQLERQAQVALPPPGVALPAQLAAPPPPAYLPQPTPPPPPALAPTLPKDFQEALDIIFPTEVKPDLTQQDSIFGLPPGFPMSLGGIPPFPPLFQPQPMFGFDLNAQLFPPRASLYDAHVPLVPQASPKPRHSRPKHDNKNKQKQQLNQQQQNQQQQQSQQQNKPEVKQEPKTEPQPPAQANGPPAKNKEEMDDLAMLGIDASDVGANI